MSAKRYLAISIVILAIIIISISVSSVFSVSASMNDRSKMPGRSMDPGSLDRLGIVWAVEVVGDYAYLGVRDHLVIADITNPLAPVLLGETDRLLAPIDSPEFDYSCTGLVRDIAVAGDYAYVAADSGGIKIVDVSNPLHPHVVGQTNSLGSMAVAVEGGFLVEGTNRCEDWGLQNGEVVIYALSDPLHPVRTGVIQHGPGYRDDINQGVDIEGNYAYSQTGYPGVVIIPLADPAAHQFFEVPDVTVLNVLAEGHYLYLTGEKQDGGTGRYVVDIADPLHPRLVNSFDGLVSSMASDDGKLYFGVRDIIDVYDLTDAANPSLFYHIDTEGYTNIKDLDAQGGCVFTGNYISLSADQGFVAFCLGSPPVTTTPSPTHIWLPLMVQAKG